MEAIIIPAEVANKLYKCGVFLKKWFKLYKKTKIVRTLLYQ